MGIVIIAEAGVNHNGDLDLAKKMVKIAADSGADFIKFQSFRPDELVTKNAPKSTYQLNSINLAENQYTMLEKLQLTESDFFDLFEECKKHNIGFLSTAFDFTSLNFLINLGIEFIKVPSGEINNLPFLRFIGRQGKPILLSTGMANMNEVKTAIDTLIESGADKATITVLHCTSAYPTPISDVNLLALTSIKKEFDISIGFSDHTLDTEIPIAAVALGAIVIEKHFTLSRDLTGPDHQASLEPPQLKSMINSIRKLEIALGDGIKRPMPSEIQNISIVRRSIVAKNNITKGDVFTLDNLALKRPGNGLSPIYWDDLLGSLATKNYFKDDLIDEA